MLQNRILIFIPIGDGCEALSWINSLLEIPEFDINFLLVCYDNTNFSKNLTGNQKIKIILDRSPSKFEKFHKYVKSGEINLAEYDFFWIVDDDVHISRKDAQKFFSEFKSRKLEIAQPGCLGFAMGKQIVRRDPRFNIRYTNYVDGMAPFFSSKALKKCIDTFENCGSGRGIDHVWAALLGNPLDKIAVIDEALMFHMNPSGANYSRFSLSIDEQYEKTKSKYITQVIPHYQWEERKVHFAEHSNKTILISSLHKVFNRASEIHKIGIMRLSRFYLAKIKVSIYSRSYHHGK